MLQATRQIKTQESPEKRFRDFHFRGPTFLTVNIFSLEFPIFVPGGLGLASFTDNGKPH